MQIITIRHCPHLHQYTQRGTSLQKQSCCFSKVFGYYNCVTILTMQILWRQWELIIELTLLASHKMFYKYHILWISIWRWCLYFCWTLIQQHNVIQTCKLMNKKFLKHYKTKTVKVSLLTLISLSHNLTSQLCTSAKRGCRYVLSSHIPIHFIQAINNAKMMYMFFTSSQSQPQWKK